MKKFISDISKYFVFASTVIIILLVATSIIARNTFDFSIPENKNILAIGNSRPEHALNDDILDNYFNLCQSGTAYFYDYVKLREISSRNPHIDTVIIGYSYGDLNKKMDQWFAGEEKIKFKIRNHFFLFNPEDYLSLLRANPIDVLTNTPQAIFHNSKMAVKTYSNMGGYVFSERFKLKEAIARLDSAAPVRPPEDSIYQSEYLIKIYNYCQANNLTLVLLNVPSHDILTTRQNNLKERYYRFASEHMPKALLVNHTEMKLPDNYYADLAHLNHLGAKVYSEYLKENGLKSNLPEEIK